MKIINNFPKITKLDNIENEVVAKAPINHASGSTSYGAGSPTEYGHVKISDSYKNSDGTASAGVTASSKAVADSYADLYNYINNFIKTTSISLKLSELTWLTSNSGKFYCSYNISNLKATKVLAANIITWSALRIGDIFSVGCNSTSILEITSNVNTFASGTSHIVVQITYI